MYCITRENMKFGEYFIPARTKATVINTPSYHEVNIPGLQLHLDIDLLQAHPKKKTGVPMSEVNINNELEPVSYGHAKSYMTGIAIWTRCDQVYMGAEDEFYDRATLSKWEIEKIVGEVIPDNITKAKYSDHYSLESVIEHLENEFALWIEDNCDFHILDEDDIENGEGFDGAEPGDRILSPHGMEQFEEKQLEYKRRLEVIGFTYEFKGGLILD